MKIYNLLAINYYLAWILLMNFAVFEVSTLYHPSMSEFASINSYSTFEETILTIIMKDSFLIIDIEELPTSLNLFSSHLHLLELKLSLILLLLLGLNLNFWGEFDSLYGQNNSE